MLVSGSAPPSRLETNFRRLLSHCSNIVVEGKLEEYDWRLEKYIGSLEVMLSDLKRSCSRPDDDIMAEFARQVEFLKGILRTEALPSPSEKALASQLLAPGLVPTTTTTARNISKEIHLRTTGKYNTEMRKELLETDGLRQRTSIPPTTTSALEGDCDAILKYHSNMQEKIAEEMVSLAKNLKENSLLAGTIIRKDTEIIEKTSKLAEQNYDNLKVESSKLEGHANKGCNWWIWMLLLVVCIVFVFMVFFMKVFTK